MECAGKVTHSGALVPKDCNVRNFETTAIKNLKRNREINVVVNVVSIDGECPDAYLYRFIGPVWIFKNKTQGHLSVRDVRANREGTVARAIFAVLCGWKTHFAVFLRIALADLFSKPWVCS